MPDRAPLAYTLTDAGREVADHVREQRAAAERVRDYLRLREKVCAPRSGFLMGVGADGETAALTVADLERLVAEVLGPDA